MSESTLSQALTSLRNNMAYVAGWGDDYSALTTAEKAKIDEWRQVGIRRVLFPPPLPGRRTSHEWSGLRPTTTMTLNAPYTTGTVAVTNNSTTVTLTTGTWPSWAASGKIIAPRSNGIPLDVATRSSDSVILLTSAYTGTTASGLEYTLLQDDYDLPDNFHRMDGPLTFLDGRDDRPIRTVRETDIMVARQRCPNESGPPRMAAPRLKTMAGATGQRYEIMFFPGLSEARVLFYRYYVLIDDLTDSLTYLPGGMAMVEVFRQSCLAAVAEGIKADDRDRQYQLFITLLTAAVSHDSMVKSRDFEGMNNDAESRLRFSRRDVGDSGITYVLDGTPI